MNLNLIRCRFFFKELRFSNKKQESARRKEGNHDLYCHLKSGIGLLLYCGNVKFGGNEPLYHRESDRRRQGHQCVAQTRINVKINSGVETEINGRGPEVSAAEREALLDRIRRIQPGDTLVLSGNVPPTLPESIYEQILAELPASSIRVVVDAEGALLRDTLRFHPFLIKPNLAELHQLVANPQAPVSDQIQELRQQGVGHILVSMGAEGSVLFTAEGGVYRQRPLPGQTVSTVGAGDSMVAGFLASLENPASTLEDSLRWAAACGTATAFSRGIARREQVEALLDQIQIEG